MMDELIERLEKATGPAFVLELAIYNAIKGSDWYLDSETGFILDQEGYRHHPPAYTANLDAALALVPEGWRCTHAYWSTDASDPGATFNLTLPQSLTQKPSVYVSGSHRHIALALTIAALKARQAAKLKQIESEPQTACLPVKE